MRNNNLSTATMIKVVQLSEDWDEQRAMLEELKRRRDLFNLEPVLRLAVDDAQHPSVRKAAAECAGAHNGAYALDWLRCRAENRFTPARERKLALQGLAALHRPNQTLPVLEHLAGNSGGREAKEVRAEAIRLVGKYRNLRSVGLLTVLERNPDEVIARAARAALDQMLEGHGGRREVTQKMLDRAEMLEARGDRQGAREVLQVAARLEPSNGRLLLKLARMAA